MRSSSVFLAVVLGVGAMHAALGCSGGGSSGRGTTTTGGDACPGTTLFTGVTCGSEQAGPTCDGTVTCSCGASHVAIATSCTCGADPVIVGGLAWTCADDCTHACDADAGVTDAGGEKPCEQFCEHQLAANCSDVMSIESCEAQTCVDFPDPACQPQWEAVILCTATMPLSCDAKGHTYAACQDQEKALAACL